LKKLIESSWSDNPDFKDWVLPVDVKVGKSLAKSYMQKIAL
jgi:hypothetical protein